MCVFTTWNHPELLKVQFNSGNHSIREGLRTRNEKRPQVAEGKGVGGVREEVGVGGGG